MKPSVYLAAWFKELFGNPGRYTIIEPGKEMPREPPDDAESAGEYTIFALDGGTFRRREVTTLIPLIARLIEIEHGGPRVQEVVFETDTGRRICVQRMVISLEDLLDGEAD